MLTEFKADLHVHTCLSPCGDLRMVPSEIVRQAVSRGLSIIAVCDHNSAENVAAVKCAAEHTELHVIGGMEIATSEEVHILGLFGADDQLREIQGLVYDHLPGNNDVRYFGEQLVANEKDNFIASNDRFLAGATRLGVEAVVAAIHESGGLAIASHVDREAFSIIGQLGFLPPGLALDALELSPRHDPQRLDTYRCHGLPLVASSDAHDVDDVGRSHTTLLMERCSFGELRMALTGMHGRRSWI